MKSPGDEYQGLLGRRGRRDKCVRWGTAVLPPGRPRDPLEGRGEQAHESAERRHAQDSEPARAMLTDINRIATLAKEDPARKFYSIAHLISEERLRQAFWKLRKDASAGIDGFVHSQYAAPRTAKSEAWETDRKKACLTDVECCRGRATGSRPACLHPQACS